MIIKTVLLYIICFIALVIYGSVSVYVYNEDNANVKLIHDIITIILPLIFVLKYLV